MTDLWTALDHLPPEVRGPRARWEAARQTTSGPLEAAILAGRGARTVGEAFFAGYQAAVERSVGRPGVQALLVTEDGGNHPRSIATRTDGATVAGQKSFVLSGVDTFWVLARRGELPDGRADLVLVEVDAGEVSERAALPMPWMRDVPHERVVLEGVPVASVLEDAWTRIVRPFRTIEDLAVLLALGAARLSAAPDAEAEEAWLAVLSSLVELWRRDPEASITIRAAAGARAIWLRESERRFAGPLAESWEEDRRLLSVAGRAREARVRKARMHV